MKIQSQIIDIKASSAEVYTFLDDANNIIHLLPQDRISDFKSDATTCSFRIQGGFVITLLEDGGEPYTTKRLKSGEKSPFPFSLIVHIQALDDHSSQVFVAFEGKVNPMMKMIVEKPLTNLSIYMANRLQAHFSINDSVE